MKFQMHKWKQGPKSWDPTGKECFENVTSDEGESLKCGRLREDHLSVLRK